MYAARRSTSAEIRRGYGRTHTEVRSGTRASFRACRPEMRAYGVNFTAAAPAGTRDQDLSLRSGSPKKGGTLRTADCDVGCVTVRLGTETGISVRPTA